MDGAVPKPSSIVVPLNVGPDSFGTSFCGGLSTDSAAGRRGTSAFIASTAHSFHAWPWPKCALLFTSSEQTISHPEIIPTEDTLQPFVISICNQLASRSSVGTVESSITRGAVSFVLGATLSGVASSFGFEHPTQQPSKNSSTRGFTGA